MKLTWWINSNPNFSEVFLIKVLFSVKLFTKQALWLKLRLYVSLVRLAEWVGKAVWVDRRDRNQGGESERGSAGESWAAVTCDHSAANQWADRGSDSGLAAWTIYYILGVGSPWCIMYVCVCVNLVRKPDITMTPARHYHC